MFIEHINKLMKGGVNTYTMRDKPILGVSHETIRKILHVEGYLPSVKTCKALLGKMGYEFNYSIVGGFSDIKLKENEKEV